MELEHAQAERKRAEEREKQYISELDFLSRRAMEFIESLLRKIYMSTMLCFTLPVIKKRWAKMRDKKAYHLVRFFPFLILISLITLSGPISYGQDEGMKHLLVLHSYHKGYSWTDNIQKGIESVLEPENNIDLTVEYMDSKSTEYNQEYKEKLFDLYTYKYRNKTFDLIISSDDNAFNILREYHEVLFPDTSIEFRRN